ncbi:MAG: outer membrane protein [Paracoccus sp. (in: a-proteobacteria)]|jgi:opacity protein-like surface antigen|uniref:outer membrane protein n=2 Tax=Paracoccus TaxID=265 RepID=UPI000C68B7D0|nr:MULTISPECIES: porin family protein [unclassified Paracoccus (in: a-proteobacteria)]MAN56195.1 hypothetical protein [Paracoccus sp. (in: a-proteobacteria)]MBA49579.1 hypothetical protein [Paracoccus sp. (in: a-proteobacteria)]MCS5600806.1 porin family protein [Paracoccus sp. (in: a-proteobacteria)]MDB2551888.1 porin family protein [Paracoccus sp. (in: a-proteobacteria)]HIC67743.1 porin family protein [Paracoccus sp. (in: a-proteobacteria)]|tara:strand:- start:3936 stop:4526 length:591 start_codon:yes stop_codon:yes gene_type:complete
MKFAIISTAAILTAGAASAGGYTAPVAESSPAIITAPVVEQGPNWGGFYGGLQYGKGNASLSNGGFDENLDAYGLHGGYLYDMGRYVVGGELDYNKINLDNNGGDGDLARLKGRAGMKFGRFMPYLTAGYARISTNQDAGDVSEGAFAYGLGAEYMVNNRFSVGAEYTRQDFKDVSNVNGLDLDTDMVQMRASYRF